MKIEIRSATAQDFGFICQMIRQLNEVPQDGVLDDEKLENIFHTALKNPTKFYYLAEHFGKAVGFMSFLFDYQLSEIGYVLTIEELVIDENFHRQGIGAKLIDFAVEFAKARDCQVMQLTTNFRRIETHQFYESQGWDKNGYRFGLSLE